MTTSEDDSEDRDTINIIVIQRTIEETTTFYQAHPEIKSSHGLQHVLAVYQHALNAIESHEQQQKQQEHGHEHPNKTDKPPHDRPTQNPPGPALTKQTCMEIQIATLLHDVDDRKYFDQHANHENARHIMLQAQIPPIHLENILEMIQLVSCSTNGNRVPAYIQENCLYHLLIPRWSDRLEAVGAIGVVRSYQYNKEHNFLLSSASSPRPQTIQQVWEYATEGRFEAYQTSGESEDMISHYYDKLLHISRPPKNLVRNKYLEEMAEVSSKELLEVCLRFGRTGIVDEEYIRGIADGLGITL